MPKFTHANYDGKHWLKGTAEYALDNELNRLNKQIMKFAKADASNSKYYKQLVTEIAKLSHNQIKWVNGVPQAKRGAKEIAKAAALNGEKQFKKIAKSKSHATFERYKKAAKKIGLTTNELSFLSNESAAYYEAMYADENDDTPLDIDDTVDYNPFQGAKYQPNPHTFNKDPISSKYDREIFVEDIIVPMQGGHYNNQTGEWFDNYDDALRSYDSTMEKLSTGEWQINTSHFGENIDWGYYNQFKRRKDW